MQLESNERETIDGAILRIDNFFGYDFINQPGSVSYSICSYLEAIGYDIDGNLIERTTDTDQYFIIKTVSISSNMDLDSSVIQSWGASDQPIFDYVATTLGITLK